MKKRSHSLQMQFCIPCPCNDDGTIEHISGGENRGGGVLPVVGSDQRGLVERAEAESLQVYNTIDREWNGGCM